MSNEEPRAKSLCPRIYAACADDPEALDELEAFVSHVDLLQEQHTEYRVVLKRSRLAGYL